MQNIFLCANVYLEKNIGLNRFETTHTLFRANSYSFFMEILLLLILGCYYNTQITFLK